MRVTQSMLNSQLLRNLDSNLGRMENLQTQTSTGKVINKPSDDPVGLSFSLRYRNSLSLNEQYQKNVDSSISWVDYTEGMVSETNDVLQRARELAVQGASGTSSDESMEAIAAEINQLYEHLVSIGNSNFNGKYIFNGQNTDIRPYDLSNAKDVTPDKGEIAYEVGVGITISNNVSGASLFGESTDATNAFKVLEDLHDNLNNHDRDAVNQSLKDLDERMNVVLEKWSDIGAKSNRLDLISNRLDDENINLQQLLSKTEDANMAELITNLKTEENIYQASLSTGAKIIQPSLVDFLR